MPRALRQPRSPSAMVPALLRYLAARGHADAVGDLIARFDLPAAAADQDEVAIEPAAIGELADAAAELLGEPHLALRLPGELPWRRYDVVELALRGSSTLGAALETAARHATAIHPALACELVVAEDEAHWIQRTPGEPRGLGRQLDTYGLAFVLHHARTGLAAPLPTTRVWFAHARPRALEPLERMFGTADLRFGMPDSGFACARALLAAPLQGDPRLLATITALVAAQPPPPRAGELAPRVTAHVREHVADSATEIARALGVSARTLQRRLEAEGTMLSAVIDGAREGLARELLADPARTLADIAERIGFSDLATFTRAFKRWTGAPPGQFRRRLRS